MCSGGSFDARYDTPRRARHGVRRAVG